MIDKDPLTEAEQEFVAKEQAKHDKKLLKQLRTVQKTGEIKGKVALETLLANDLIRFGPPRDDIVYNCYRLTEKGLAFVERLVTLS